MTTEHLDQAGLAASLAGEASDQMESKIHEHLSHCDQCRQRLQALAESGHVEARIVEVLRVEAQAVRSGGDAFPSRLFPEGSGDSARVPIYPHQYAQAPADFAVSFLEPSDHQDSLGRLGEFEIFSVIGFGGMGIVMKGFQPELGRPVAVKVMAPHLATSGAARQRFLREAQAAAAIVHPNVMPILSVSEKASLPLLVMPYVACHSLQQRLDAEGPLGVVDVLRIAVQVADGLAAAHAQGLVHRDVKPANILLERGLDRALLTDFGLARAVDDASVTRSGVIAGTPQYMSPEQARGEAVDARSDLFSLGSVIYAMCVGRPPFRGETSYGILRKVIEQQPDAMRTGNPSVPVWLDRLTSRLMSKQAEDRYESAAKVAQLLGQCLAHVQQPAACELPPSLGHDGVSRHRYRIWMPALVVAAVLLLGIGWVHHNQDGPQQVDSSTGSQVAVGEPSQRPVTNFNSDPVDWDDGLQRQIDQLHQQADELLSRSAAGLPELPSAQSLIPQPIP